MSMNRKKHKHTEEVIRTVNVSEIPLGRTRGRQAFIVALPFWNDLIDELKKGLGPKEAKEINLSLVAKQAGITMDPARVVTCIRYQFTKQGLSEKYSLRFPKKGNSVYVMDHQSAAELAA
jgi:hypothetical protein